MKSGKRMIGKMMLNIIAIPQKMKTAYKRKKFHRYAQVGNNLALCAHSNCDAEKQGLIRIGDACEIRGRLESQGDGRIEIGHHTGIYDRSVIGSVNSIRIGNCVMISNHVHIYDNNNHPISPSLRHEMSMQGLRGEQWRWTHSESAPVIIEDDVWIGEYALILKGVTIGKGAVVAAHAVVTKDVPPMTVVAGNPARVVKEIEA